MPASPSQFDSTPAALLFAEASMGLIGFDQRLIRSLIGRPEETLAAMDAMLAGADEDSLLDLTEQYFDLYRHFRSPEAIPFYLTLLAKRGDSIPDPLMEAFADLGEPAVEPLLALHDSSAEDDRPDIVFLLATLGVDDPRIRSLIEETLERDPYEGALAAGLYGDAALQPAVQRCVENAQQESEERKVLEECLAALARPRGPHEPSAFDILDLYPAEALPLFDQIEQEEVIKFFDSADPIYRARAAASFADDTYSDEIRDRLVALAANDLEASVRGSAWRALGERIDEPAIREKLIAVIENRADQVPEWTGALVGLSGATSEPEVHDAILAAYEDESTRAAALQTMWRSLDSRYKKYLAPNLRHENLEVRRQAIQGVGAFEIPELALELVPLFDDDEVREETLFAYTLAVRHATTPKSVGKLFDMISEKAGGLTDSEEDTVAIALDRRLEKLGYEPVYFPDEEHEHDGDEIVPPVEQARSEKTGRNDPCPCGSGKKYKKCCGASV